MRSAEITSRSWWRSFKERLIPGGLVNASIRDMDPFFLATVLALLAFGLLMVYSASFIFASERTGNGYSFILRQMGFASIGLLLMWGAARVDYRVWFRFGYPVFFLALLMLVLVLVPGIGHKVGGAQRWLSFGPAGFQPGEFAKFALVVFVARSLTKKRDRLDGFTAGVLSNYLVPLPALALLLLQPDFGTATIIATVIFAMMFVAGVRLRYLLGTVMVLAGTAGALMWNSPYRRARLLAFLDPWEDPAGSGFQILQSLVGLHNGHFWGTGLGNGKGKLFYLPEAHNDFIFAVIGEELGFIGLTAVALVFSFFVYRGLRIGWNAYRSHGDHFALLLAAGLTLVVGLQGFINMAVVMGILPTKGLTLPFISYGGSALMMNLFVAGVLLNISAAKAGHGAWCEFPRADRSSSKTGRSRSRPKRRPVAQPRFAHRTES